MTPHPASIINQHRRVPQQPQTNPFRPLIKPNMTPDIIFGAGLLDRSNLGPVDGNALRGQEGEERVVVYRGREGRPEGEAGDVGFGEDDEVCVAGARGFADEGEGFGEGGAGVHVNGGDVAGYGFEVVSEVWFDLGDGVVAFFFFIRMAR